MNKEQWAPVVGFENDYAISNAGRIKRISKTNRVDVVHLKPTLAVHGYWVIGLTVKGKTKTRYVHRMLAQAFLPNPKRLP